MAAVAPGTYVPFTDAVTEPAQRIRRDFGLLPGLALTLAQAQRLWALHEGACRDVLDGLVGQRFLSVRADGRYVLRESSWASAAATGDHARTGGEGAAAASHPVAKPRADRRRRRLAIPACDTCGRAQPTVLSRTEYAVYVRCLPCGSIWSVAKPGEALP